MTKGQRIRAALKQALKVREGQVLTPEIIEDRAGNGAEYVMEVLRQIEREEREPTPTGYEVGETAEEMAARLIK